MTGRRRIEGNRSERFAGRVMAVTIQKGHSQNQKEPLAFRAGWKGASTAYLLWRIYDLRGWYAGTIIRISENFEMPDRASNNRNVYFAAAGDGIECIV